MPEQATSGHLLVSARPRFEVEGQERSRLSVDLLRLEVCADEEGMARLEAVFINWGVQEEGKAPSYLYYDGQILDLGKRLKVHAGDDDNEAIIFEGVITAIAGNFGDLRPPEIRVHAEDALQLMRLSERTRFYERKDEEALVSQIASDHGLTGRGDARGTEHKELWQVNQNDLGFLRERARAADARLEVGDGELRFVPRRKPGEDPIRLSKESALVRFEAVADLAHQRAKVHVHGWSIADKEAIHESAGDDAVQAEARGGRTGPSVLSELGWAAEEHLHLETPATTAEAQAIARSLSLRRGRRFLVGRGTTDGTPKIKVGSELELLDIGDWFSGFWIASSVRHTYDLMQGLRTHFVAERVDLGRAG